MKLRKEDMGGGKLYMVIDRKGDALCSMVSDAMLSDPHGRKAFAKILRRSRAAIRSRGSAL